MLLRHNTIVGMKVKFSIWSVFLVSNGFDLSILRLNQFVQEHVLLEVEGENLYASKIGGLNSWQTLTNSSSSTFR